MIYIVGVGGVGSFLAEAMVRLTAPDMITLVDGDKLEEKNLDRQLFTQDQIGLNKAVALGAKLKCKFIDEFYNPGLVRHGDIDWLIACVDNNPARRSVLRAADLFGCRTITAANEVHSSEAYYYEYKWAGTRLDPRIYYPEIESDDSGNPEAIRIGCTGKAQEENRQLVTANFMAAALAAHLFVVWGIERHSLDDDTLPYLPFRLRQNLTKNEYTSEMTIQKEQNV